MNKLKHQRNQIARQIGNEFKKFNKNVCSDCPKAGANHWTTIERGCCESCFVNNGYFNNLYSKKTWSLNDKKLFEDLSKRYGFNQIYGFFDNNKKSCKIRRSFRSFLCVRYCCDACDEKLDKVLIWDLASDYANIKKRLGELV